MGVKNSMDTFFAAMGGNLASSNGYGSRIISTPMGPFTWNDDLNAWVNVNNGFQLNNIAFQDMYAMMDYAANLSGGVDQAVASVPGMYGSRVAGQMLLAAINGTNSVDFVTFGDSNAGMNGGWQVGWEYAVNSRVSVYATPLLMMDCYATNEVTRIGGLINRYVEFDMSGDSNADGSNATTFIFPRVMSGSGAIPTGIKSLTGLTYGDGTSEGRPLGFTYDIPYMGSGATWRGAYNRNYIAVGIGSPLSSVTGTTLAHRIVRATVPTALGGTYYSTVWPHNSSDGFAGSVQRSTPFRTGAGAGFGYTMDTNEFRVNDTSVKYKAYFDSSSDSPQMISGGWAGFFHSIVSKNKKGAVVSNIQYYGGRTTALLYTSILNFGSLTNYFLDELAQRQKYAGSSTGKVIFWINSGINAPDDASSWTNSATSIKDAIISGWTGLGYDSNDLSLIFSITHPVTDNTSNWTTRRDAISSAAKTFANTFAYQNVTYIDIGELYSGAQLLGLNYYDGGGQAHLTSTGYINIAETMCQQLLKYT